VPTDCGQHDFLVGKPIFVSESPGAAGSRTHGYVAWDIQNKRFAFLNLDAWRRKGGGSATEGKVLQQLRAAGVVNIPTYVCDAETTVETTGTDRGAPAAQQLGAEKPPLENVKAVRSYLHYRLVVKDVCLPLRDSNSGKPLVSI
ncbi:hypothetical protein K466DRAFT_454414, partial [Polyporus arcularius HHB13444]